MRSSSDHLEQARRNHQLYDLFLQDGHDPDWALTLLFYAALHLVQAYAMRDCPRRGRAVPAHHTERLEYVRDRLGSVFRQYRRLQAASEQARYDLSQPSWQEVQDYHDQEFAAIEAELRRRGTSFR